MSVFKFKIYHLLLVLIITCSITACSKFTDVNLPSSQLSTGAVFEDKATANAAITDIYAKIRETGLLSGRNTGLSVQLGLYADELQYYGLPTTGQANFYNNSLTALGSEITTLWTSSYNQIYAANALVEGISKSSTLQAVDKQQYMGEALFVRALLHFYLVNSFGPIPYIKTTNYQQNKVANRMPEAEVYALIKSDLEQSITLLPAQYNGAERVRPNKGAAQAMLARVCLYMKKWDEASNAASAILDQSSLYKWPTDLHTVFVKESPSTIWQLTPATTTENTYEAKSFIFIQGPPPSVAISSSLLGAFTDNDLRRDRWINKVTTGTSSWYHANKYKERLATTASKEYSIVLRTAEQYLIRAESRAHHGNLTGAKEDLNKVRNLAGLANSSASTVDEIIDAVLQERRLELFTEFGHRFFDLKRTGKLNIVLSPLKPQWGIADQFLPIPESELLLNPNLKPQNAGY